MVQIIKFIKVDDGKIYLNIFSGKRKNSMQWKVDVTMLERRDRYQREWWVVVRTKLSRPSSPVGDRKGKPMVCASLFGHPLTWTWINSYTLPLLRVKFQNRPASVHFSLSSNIPVTNDSNQHSIHMDSLRALEWDKLCDSVASFARTSLGRQAIKVCIAAKFSFSCPWFRFSYEEHCFTF